MYGLFVAVSAYMECCYGLVSTIGTNGSWEKKEHSHKCPVYGAQNDIQ